jgi:hypothetical protein
MLVLIDESGDPGFKISKGSTPFFVVALVIFQDMRQAEKCSAAITEIRTALGYRSEFKFSKTNSAGKDAFFQAVRPYLFEVRALVVEKDLIYSDRLRTDDDAFYNYFLRQLLTHCNDLQAARVKIDGSGDREFKRRLEKYLKRGVQAGKVTSVKFADSAKDNLIQLADMAVGAIARSYRKDESPMKSGRWRQMLGPKLVNCWEFK